MRLPPTGAAPWTLRIPSGTSSILLAIFDSPHLCRTKGPRVEAGLESGPMRVIAKRARNNPGPNPRPDPRRAQARLTIQSYDCFAARRAAREASEPGGG